MTKIPEEDPSGYGQKSPPVPPEVLAQYRWGVFKSGVEIYVNTYYNEMNYPTLVKGNLTKEEAEKLAESMRGTK